MAATKTLTRWLHTGRSRFYYALREGSEGRYSALVYPISARLWRWWAYGIAHGESKTREAAQRAAERAMDNGQEAVR